MSPEFKQHRDEELQSLTTQLFERLLSIFPSLPRESEAALYHNVIVPAAHLEAKLHLSSSKYVFRDMKKLGGEFLPLPWEKMKKITCQDVKSKRIVKPDSSVGLDERGNVGTPLLQKEPSLERVERNTSIVLRSARWVLDFHTPILKQGRKGTR